MIAKPLKTYGMLCRYSPSVERVISTGGVDAALGEENIVLQKDLGCDICLAHDCNKDFACLKAISHEEVMTYIDKLLSAKNN